MNGFFLVAHYIFLATEIIKNAVQMKYCFLPNTCINALAKTKTKKFKVDKYSQPWPGGSGATGSQQESSIVSFFFTRAMGRTLIRKVKMDIWMI